MPIRKYKEILESIMEPKQPLRVVTLNYPPFSYIDSQGNYDGMEVRFLKYENPDEQISISDIFFRQKS